MGQLAPYAIAAVVGALGKKMTSKKKSSTPGPVDIPTDEAKIKLERRRRATLEAQRRSGRASTILSDYTQQKLGD